ncbi:MAG: hypothetical protein IH623_20120 [Verrucomicrobia bacterium]|nr:hypothetical protein [Verrucomicrobiota bacterium]
MKKLPDKACWIKCRKIDPIVQRIKRAMGGKAIENLSAAEARRSLKAAKELIIALEQCRP